MEVFLTNKRLKALKGREEQGKKRERRPSACPLKFKSRLKKFRAGKGKAGEEGGAEGWIVWR